MKLIKFNLLILALLCVFCLSAQADDLKFQGKARIYSIEGDVMVWRGAFTQWTRAREGEFLEKNDRVVTGEVGSTVIWFDDSGKDKVTLQPQTELIFRNIEPTEAYLKKGHVLVRLDDLEPGMTFKVGTRDAVTGVFGTTFEVIKEGEKTLVITREGKVRVFDTTNDSTKAEFSTRSWWDGAGVMGSR